MAVLATGSNNRCLRASVRFVDSALTGSVTGAEALADPYDARITLSSPAFLRLPHLAPIVSDMHFVVRDRLGRLLAFLARLHQDGRAPAAGPPPLSSTGAVGGIGVDQGTALLIEPDGSTSIVGSGTAYFISLQPNTSRVCAHGEPLSVGVMPAYRLDAKTGGRFDLSRWQGSGGVSYNITVRDGKIAGGYGPH
jgi:cyanophycinase